VRVEARDSCGVLFAASLMLSLGYGTVFPLLADLQDKHGLSVSSLGLISAAAFGASVVGQTFLARYADRGRTRLLLIGGLAAAGLATLWIGFATELWQFVAARTLEGLGGGCFLPAARAVIIARNPENPGPGLGYLTSADVGGFLLGPPVGAFIAQELTLEAPFFILSALTLVTLPALLFLRVPASLESTTTRLPVRLLLRSRSIWAALFVGAALFFPVGVYDTIWDRYLTDLGASSLFVGLGLLAFGLPVAVLAPMGGRVAERIGPFRACMLALAVTVPLMPFYGYFDSYWVVSALVIIEAFAAAVQIPGGQAMIARASPEGLVGAGQGLFGAVNLGAAFVSALIAAPIYEAFGPFALFSATAVVMAALGLGALAVGRAELRARTGIAEPATAD
jgi:DHA1 family multidrug resistance protein-like MFS transporter